MNDNIQEINNYCLTPQDLFKSDDFLRGISTILKNIKLENNAFVLDIFKKIGNNEPLIDIEKDIITSVLENNEFQDKLEHYLKKLENVSLNIKYKNIDENKEFLKLFEEITGYNGVKLICDTLIISVKDSTKEVLEFKERESLDDIGEKA